MAKFDETEKITLRAKMSADEVLDLRDRLGRVFTLVDLRWTKTSGVAELEFTVRDGLMLLQQIDSAYSGKESSQ